MAPNKYNINMENFNVCTVIQVDSLRKVCRIKSPKGDIEGIAKIGSSVFIPANGGSSKALVDYSSSVPVVVSFIEQTSVYASADEVDKSISSKALEKDIFESVFGGYETYSTYSETEQQLNFRYNDPYDLIPGDKLIHNPFEGNHLLIGRGGVNVLKVSDFMQFIQNALDNKSLLISPQLDTMTDFGLSSYVNDEGKVRLHIKGARTNDRVRNEDYNIDLQLGYCTDDNVLSFTYNTEENNETVMVTIDTEGRLFTNIPNDSMNIFGQNQITSIAKNEGKYVGENSEWEIKQNHLVKIDGKQVITTSGSGTIRHGSDGITSEANALVRRPHLDKYKSIVDKLGNSLMTEPKTDIPGLPFMLRSPEFSLLKIECFTQSPLIDLDKTSKLWGE